MMHNMEKISIIVPCYIARNVKKQPFGAFADAASSYILVGFLGACIGYSVYTDGGMFLCFWMGIDYFGGSIGYNI